jgi:uncharacterized membrane protein YidH (DUF202 family)
LRGALYMAIAMITAALSEMDDVTAERLASLTWLDWLKTSLTIVSAGLITLRTFIDQSMGTHEKNLKANDDGNGTPAG